MVSVPARRAASGVCDGPGPVAAAGLHAASVARSALALSIAQAREGRAGAGADGGACGAVSALRLPAHPRSFSAATVIAMSVGRAYRLWRAAGLQVPRKRPRKRIGDGPAHGRRRRRGRTRCGPTTSCSTGAPTASSSSA